MKEVWDKRQLHIYTRNSSLVVSSSHSLTVQSRTLQNFQASRSLHISDPLFSATDEPELAEWEPDDITAQIGKLELNQDRTTSQSVPLNSSQEERMGHFHIDPITGHITAVTLDPRGSAHMRPHADGMWREKVERRWMSWMQGWEGVFTMWVLRTRCPQGGKISGADVYTERGISLLFPLFLYFVYLIDLNLTLPLTIETSVGLWKSYECIWIELWSRVWFWSTSVKCERIFAATINQGDSIAF